MLLRAANQAFQVTGRLAACFIAHPARVEHSLEKRVFALALGYETSTITTCFADHSLLALALDGPVIGATRARSTGWSWVRCCRGPLQEGRGEHQIGLVDLFLDMH